MSNLFYFIGFFIFLFTGVKFYYLSKIVDISDWIKKFKKVTSKSPIPSDFRNKKEWAVASLFGIVAIFESLWTYVGLLTDNYLFFILMLILGLITNLISKYSNILIQKIVIYILHTVRFLLIGLMVFNHFHFKLNLSEYLFSLFY